ncbi:MAG: hypothetical protein H6Q89_5167, partial [Myxococcaceae bacterium]|nr:hypothetical protein [Myxococcaceae bacterium]
MTMNHRRHAALLLCLLPAVAAAQLIRGPYQQTSTPNSITLVWRTLLSEASVVKYGTAVGALTQTATGTVGTEHVVKLTGLTANTRYFYSVGTATTVRAPASSADAPQHYFDTHPAPGTKQRFRFWVVGDDGTGGSTQTTMIQGAKTFLARPGQAWPDFFVHVGDMAYNSGTDLEFTTRHFAPHQSMMRNMVVWPALGNHEGQSSNGATGAGPYFDAYVLPKAAEAGGVASGTEAYYSFDYANAHFVVLDSYDLSRSATGTMATWLKSDLIATAQDWLIVYFHHPPYTRGTHG